MNTRTGGGERNEGTASTNWTMICVEGDLTRSLIGGC